MLQNIKSYYLSQIIFSFIFEKRKLDLIKYNKNLQKKLDINLFHFIRISQKYIKYESKNNGKEYSFKDDALLYEGEYLNGKRNGKGKEYENRKIKFEGEYLNGKRNGKGKEYYYYLDGQLLFEGEYKDGKKNKKGIDYYSSGKLQLEGEYLNGKKWNWKIIDGFNNNKEYIIKNGNGYLKEFQRSRLLYEGDILNGELNGKGKEYDKDERILYEGEYKNGERNGKGKEYGHFKQLKFEGEYLKGKRWNGKGYIKEYNDNDKLAFEGEYLNGKRNGKSKECYDKGKI